MQAVKAILVLATSLLAGWGGQRALGSTTAHPAVQQYLENPSFEWKCDKTEHFQICVERDAQNDHAIGLLKRNAERDRTQVLNFAGDPAYDHMIHVFLVKSRTRMKDLIGFDVDGRSRPAQHALFSVVTPYRLHLTHELCHEIFTNIWGAAEPWVEEGFATYATESLTVDQHCWHWLSSGQLLPLAKLVNAEWNTSLYSPDVTYPELGGFVKFLRETYGIDRVKDVWQGGSDSILHVFGKPLGTLEAEWLKALKQRAAKQRVPAA